MTRETRLTDDGWFTNLADSLPVLIWCSGSDGLCTFFNTRWLEFTGRPLEDSVGEGWVEDVHPEDRERVLREYNHHLQARQKFRLEYRLRSKSGLYKWIVDFGSPVLTRDRTFQGYVGGCIDVTLTQGTAVASSWREKYEAAVHAGAGQVIDRIQTAEVAIRDRLEDEPSDQAEKECLTEALAKLLAMKRSLWPHD